MEIRQLSPAIGAELVSVDLRDAFSDAEQAEARAAFAKYHLLLIRNQDITPEQQKRFAEYFGPTVLTHKTRPEDGLMFISNREEDGAAGDGTLPFHSDHTYFEEPDTSALALYALQVPASGGETVYANTLRAYDDLPQPLRERIAGLHALHTSTQRYTGNFQCVQPLARILPDVGRPILFVSQFCKDGIVELPEEEGKALLSELFAHLYREELLYKHQWRVGDFIIWDNRILQHARTNFDPSEPRTLRRSTIGTPEKVIEVGVPA